MGFLPPRQLRTIPQAQFLGNKSCARRHFGFPYRRLSSRRCGYPVALSLSLSPFIRARFPVDGCFSSDGYGGNHKRSRFENSCFIGINNKPPSCVTQRLLLSPSPWIGISTSGSILNEGILYSASKQFYVHRQLESRPNLTRQSNHIIPRW